MAALFALGLLSPVAAFAFSPAPAHCLTLAVPIQAVSEGHHHGAGDHAGHVAMSHENMAHKHTDQGAQAAAGGHDDAGVPTKCCGLFCLTALTPPAFGAAAMGLVAASDIALPTATSLLGRTPNGIDRPPRSLSSI